MKIQHFAIFISALATLIVSSAQAQELAKIPSNFDITPWVVPNEIMPDKNYPRNWGDFPSPCSYSNFRYDDPIQMPGQFSASPLMAFFGNTLANANSTYQSLRTTGESTCWGGPVNRSSFYMPAMMTAAGKVLRPELLDVFYKGNETTKPFPRGLKMMIGRKFMDQSYQWNTASPRYAWSFGSPGLWWSQDYKGWIYQTFNPAIYPDYAFTNGSYRQIIRVVAPDCWDGKNLDSSDHYSHLAYSGPDASMTNACPADHPVKIPQTTITVAYNWIDRADVTGWYLSSDKFGLKNDPPGTNFYVGFIPAWDDNIEDIWVSKILNQKWYGAYSRIGDGRRLELPPTSKIYPHTDLEKIGRQPRFLWSLFGWGWTAEGIIQPANQRIDPPPR